MWEFWTYDDDGDRPFWLEYCRRRERDLTVEAKFLARLNYLKDQPQHKWVREPAAQLHHKDYPQIFEIRFKALNVQQRPLGCFWSPYARFLLLAWAEERGGKLTPKNWVEIIHQRFASVRRNPSKAIPLEKLLNEKE